MIPGAVFVMGIIIVLSFLIVVLVMWYGTRSDANHAAHEPSQAVAYWTAQADKIEAKLSPATSLAAAETSAAAADDEAEKQRKREEALARKAARASKQTPATE